MASISEKVKDKYKMAPHFSPGIYHFNGGVIDTTTVDLETLEKAVANGLDVVKEIKPITVSKKDK
jgi:hypothetical protein